MLPPDTPPSAPLSVGEQTGMLTDGENKVSPATFPVPSPSPDYIETLASDLRSAGESVGDTGNDITSAWSGLRSHYKAPEAEHLYSVLEPVAADGDTVSTDLGHAASALETFAADLRDIKSRWSSLSAEAFEFRARIDAKGDDWRKAEGVAGFFGIGENPDVEENQRLIDEGIRIIEDYADAELACANAINRFVPDRTPFERTPSGDGALDPDVFYHGYEEDLSDLATEWDMGGAVTDESWLVDGWDAVWDFGVGAVEGTGAMLGMHSSEGWFNMSWGDALYEYHESNIQSVASLVGMYDAESDSYGWSGWDTVGSAWKDLAHSVVPWEEWGERPGYVIGTAVLNIGVTALGAALSATGVGAAVGVPLMAWRGMAIVDGMGGRGGGSGSGGAADVDVDLPANIPAFGGSGAPVVRIDTSVFDTDGLSPQQLGDLRGSLDRLQGITNDPADGSHADGSPPPRSAPVQGDSDPSESRRPTARPVADRETGANERPSRAEPETDRAGVDDEQALLEEVSGEERGSSPVPVIEDASDTSHRSSPTESGYQDPTAEQLSESDRLLRQVNGMFTAEDHADFQVNQRAETALYEGDRATVDTDSSSLKDSQVAERYGLDGRANAAFSDMRAVASDYPHVNWEGGPGDGRDVRDGRDEPEADREYATTGPRPHADTASAQRAIPHSRVQHVDLGDSGSHRIDASRVGAPDARSGSDPGFRHDHGADTGTHRPVAVNRADSVPSGDGGSGVDTPLRGDGPSGLGGSDRTDSVDAVPAVVTPTRAGVPGSSGGPSGGTGGSGNQNGRSGPGGGNSSSGIPSDKPPHDSNGAGSPQQELPRSKDADIPARKFDGISREDLNREIAQEIGLKPDTPYKVFAKKFTDFLNDKISNGKDKYFLEFYNSNGSRFRIQRDVFGFKIPQLTSVNGSAPWFAMETLPEPDAPKYRTLNDRVYFSAENSKNTTSEMDDYAEQRRQSIKDDLAAEKKLKEKKEEHKNYPGEHPEVLKADAEHSPLHKKMTKDSETYGEEGAKVAVKDLFDGHHSLPGKDGNVIDLPEIEEIKGSKKPYETPGTPRSGNYQFDQIWPLKGGGILIVEAKSSQSTSLGERTIPAGKEPKRVSQGTPEYLEATTKDMKRRGRKNQLGDPTEERLAEMIEEARAAGKLFYAEVKGITPEQKQKALGEDPKEGEKHSGYSIGLFDIPKK
ncbi:Uncharacterised protein [Nocardiopsis dassonvillei]|uniref:Uncharacterized protein n=2 Tax=Nocardiopsis dassonvillei TaxID=2014 RepID=D7B7Q1_NOCDD|nr:hypothetical protein [Nocardiopsis dassonvillei]ADH69446.1 hypothetical protein Ndas_4050 [Nocardiopsis dassonvillei subsp. dassonvillei DSM 43111]VEI89956.1 Uncharacterised protein [Nocardiopsis dassonvillei]